MISRPRPRATPAARWTSSTASPATRPRRRRAPAPGAAAGRLRHRRPDRRAGAGRPPAVRHPRRDRHGGIDPADHRQHPVEEARRRPARPGDGREDRQRRVRRHRSSMARRLAQSLVQVAAGAGLPTRAWITDMNQVLGHSCGNALEVQEAVDFLRGDRARAAPAAGDARAVRRTAADRPPGWTTTTPRSHASTPRWPAAPRWSASPRMVPALGGPADFCDCSARHLAAAPVVQPCSRARGGWVCGMDTRDIGLAIIELGGGRRQAGDAIDHRVGFADMLRSASMSNAVMLWRRCMPPTRTPPVSPCDACKPAFASATRHRPKGRC